MRRSILAVMAAGSVFAFTAASASSVTVSGSPFNPKVGSVAATTCDLGSLTVATQNDGTNYTGFTVTAATDASSDAACTDVYLYVKIPVTGTNAGNMYARITAKADYTSATGTAATFTIGSNVYTTLATANAGSTQFGTLPISGNTLGTASLLISPQVTANF